MIFVQTSTGKIKSNLISKQQHLAKFLFSLKRQKASCFMILIPSKIAPNLTLPCLAKSMKILLFNVRVEWIYSYLKPPIFKNCCKFYERK